MQTTSQSSEATISIDEPSVWSRSLSLSGKVIIRAASLAKIVAALLPFFLALAVYFGAFLIMDDPPVTGDEPHYLLAAYSLSHDGDVDLRNNYEGGDWTTFYTNTNLDSHAYDYRGDGRLISIHNIGLPLLITPIFYLTGGSLFAVRVLVIVIAALFADQLFRLLKDFNIAGPLLVWPVWAAVAFCLPLLIFSNQIYPEVPAALLTVSGARALLDRNSSRPNLFLAALAAGALPWLHVRYLILSAGLVAGMLYRLPAPRLSASSLLTLAPAALSFILLAIVFNSWYGSPLPNAPYEPYDQLDTWSLPTIYREGIGSILSPSDGWLPYVPVHLLGLAGLLLFAVRFRLAAAWALLFIGSYVLTVSSYPFGHGFSFPARFLVPVIPLIGLPLLLLVRSNLPSRVLFTGLLGLSFVIGYTSVANHQDLYPSTSRTRVPVASALQDAWPIFESSSTGFSVVPGTAPRTAGSIVAVASSGQPGPVEVAQASPPQDPPGLLAYGPYESLWAGAYVAKFTIAAGVQDPTDHVATLNILASPTTLAQKELRGLDLPPGGDFTTVELPFSVPSSDLQVETRVYYTGEARVSLKSIEVAPLLIGGGVNRDFPNWPQSLLWIVVTAFVAFLVARRSEPEQPPAGVLPQDDEPPPPLPTRDR